MTDTPLTERLEARAADLPDDNGYHHATRLLLREAKAALEALAFARAEPDWGQIDFVPMSARERGWALRARMLERRADTTQAENEALVALLEAAEAREKELEAKQRIDEQQCDEMTDRAGRYLQRAEAAEARAKELEGANELRSELLWKQTRRVGELTEALGDVLEARRQFGCLSSGAAEHRLHLAAEKAQDVLAGLDGGEQ